MLVENDANEDCVFWLKKFKNYLILNKLNFIILIQINFELSYLNII